MKTSDLSLNGPKILEPKVFRDERGFFLESFNAEIAAEVGIEKFVQDNRSFSKYKTLRGMHFQTSPGQAKLVQVLTGKIYDVVVDIRPSSDTFGRWVAVELCADDFQLLFIPIGFAHGFCVISPEGAQISYKVSTPYVPETEATFNYKDPQFAIRWPVDEPLLSFRDSQAANFTVCK